MTDTTRHYYKGNSLKQLRAFCAVARAGSMTDAARELFLSQSAVSLQVKALEEQMGVELFERRGPNISLTPDGRKLMDMARPLVEGIDDLPQRFEHEVRGSADSGELVIAGGESAMTYILPDLLGRFQKDHRGIQVSLRNVGISEGLGLIRDDEADFAVGSMLDVPSDIAYTPMWSHAPMLIMPAGHPLAGQDDIQLADIAAHDLILPPRRLTTWRLVDRVFQQHGVPFNVALEVNGWGVIKRLVEAGLGLSIVSGVCVLDDDNLIARDMSAHFPRRDYGIVTRRGRHLPAPARAFLEAIQDTAPPRSPWEQEGHSSR
mgnify:CR=1 FL=1